VALATTAVISFVVYAFVLTVSDEVKRRKPRQMLSTASESLQLVLRAAAAKPTSLHSTSTESKSAKIALFSILMGEFVVFVAFR